MTGKEILYCAICGHLAMTLGEDPAHVVHEIKIPSAKTTIFICVGCGDDLRNYLTGKVAGYEDVG
jgi:hypothetical protein